MARLKVRSIIQILVLFAVCIASAIIGFALRNNNASDPKSSQPSALQQSDEKVIEVQEFPSKPFEFSDLGVKKVKILSGQKLNVRTMAESEEWLDDLEFKIKNKWDKQIIYIHIDLLFPETFAVGPLMKGKLDVGTHPQGTENDKRFGKPLALNPGETFTYTLSKHWLTQIKKFLGRNGFQLANLNKAVIRVGTICFNDGTAWIEGNWFRHNPNNPTAPGGYEKINQ